MKRKKWTDEKKKEVVRRCDLAKENGASVGETLRDAGASTSQLCQWRKEFRKITCPPEILEEFGIEPEPAEDLKEKFKVDTFEDGRININDEYRRETIATQLFMSGYTIWQTVEAGQYFINFQKD